MAYSRIIVKISGEALSGSGGECYNSAVLKDISGQLSDILSSGVQVGLVIGAGNIWRGRMDADMNRSVADNMGMLATLVNALCMADCINRSGASAKVLSAVSIDSVADRFTRDKAEEAFQKNCAVIFAFGTGNPFFTTDTAAALRACEVEADAVFYAKNIDGVYDSDPKNNSNARKFKTISYSDIIAKDIKFIDQTAAILLRDNDIDSVAFYLNEQNGIRNAVLNGTYGTLIRKDIETAF